MATIRPRRLVVVGGTWEKQWGMLGPVVHETKKDWPAVWVDYPASYSTPMAFEESLDRGVTALILALRYEIPDGCDIAIICFSQGCAVVEQALREMRRTGTLVNASILRRIRYVALCGNPYRAAGDQVGPDPGGFGVIGPLADPGDVPIPGRWDNFALPGDLISSCGKDSLVRAIYPYTRWMSIQTPDRWARDVLSRNGAVWLWRNVPELRDPRHLHTLLRRVAAAAQQIDYYLASKVHGQYMVRALGPDQPTAGRMIVRALEEISWNS